MSNIIVLNSLIDLEYDVKATGGFLFFFFTNHCFVYNEKKYLYNLNNFYIKLKEVDKFKTVINSQSNELKH